MPISGEDLEQRSSYRTLNFSLRYLTGFSKRLCNEIFRQLILFLYKDIIKN